MPTELTAALRARLKELDAERSQIDSERKQITRFLGSLIKKAKKGTGTLVKTRKIRRRKVTWTAAMRAAAARRMKARWKERQAKKG